MNPARLLQHFERISEAPDAIPRLRRFILDLAVRGKLVEQDPNDEPAGELLKRIQTEKERLAKREKVQKVKLNAPMVDENTPFNLPSGWQWSSLAAIGSISPRNDADSELPTSFVPMPMIPAEYGIPHTHEVRLWGEIKSGYTHFAEGDVALAKITPCFENGKSTVFRGLTGGVGAGTTELHVVRPLFINANFILLFVKCPYFIEAGVPQMTGTAGQKRVPVDYFAYSPFPLPPLAEQHRIVAKVDELMALCDDLEASQARREERRDRLVAATLHRLNNGDATLKESARFSFTHLPRLTTRPEHIQQLRQTILNLAVRGKLVVQDPNDEPASELLKKIQAEKDRLVKAGKVRKEKTTPAMQAQEQPWAIPPGWQWARFIDYALDIATGPFGSVLHQADYVTDGIPLVNPSHMINGRIVPDYKVTVDAKTAQRLAIYRLKAGDIVMARRGEVGRAALVSYLEEGWLCGTGSFFLRFHRDACREYILLLFRCKPVRDYLAGEAVGITMGNLNHGILKKMPLPLPPLTEQHRIVAKVDALMALCDELEAQLTTTATTRSKLLEATLHETLALGRGNCPGQRPVAGTAHGYCRPTC